MSNEVDFACLQDKKKVACRYDWHQTGNCVVVTIYAKNSIPDFCSIEANRTVVSGLTQKEFLKTDHSEHPQYLKWTDLFQLLH